ncbi:YdaU family protein [Phaeobacter sp. CNT1-3]|nr:YdaU family protein [Phaeobacter sp. CNT1-3]
MRHGSDWYKREPQAYLGGVQGLSAKEHAVYSVVLDLTYAHGGSINNDPKWIAGWISDMGSAAVRKALESLCSRGKLTIENDQITQKRAKKEAKTKEKLRETAQKNGKKGGQKSAEIRSASNNNSNLGAATGSCESQADKIREDKSIDNKEDKSSSLSCDDGYQKFLAIHPRPRETPEGAQSWSQAVAAGQDPESLIAAARRYAEAAKAFDPDKVKFSDNWLRDRSWEKYPEAAAKRPVGRREVLQFNADWVNGDKFISPNVISRSMVEELVGAGFVTEARAKERGLL